MKEKIFGRLTKPYVVVVVMAFSKGPQRYAYAERRADMVESRCMCLLGAGHPPSIAPMYLMIRTMAKKCIMGSEINSATVWVHTDPQARDK